MLTLLITLLVLFIGSSAFLSASETAFFSLSSAKIRTYKVHFESRARLVAQLLAKPGELLVTILILNILMNILIQNVVSSIFGTFSNWFLTAGVPLLLTLVFGEVIPKTVAISANEKIATSVAPTLFFIKRSLGPFRILMNKIASFLAHFFFFFLKKEPEISLEELKFALQASRDFGVINREEAKLIRGYLELEDANAKELMRHKDEILFYDLQQPLSNLIYLFVDKECTKVPVCEGSLENLKGIITIDQYFLHQKEISSSHGLLPFLKKPFFVPESSSGKTLFFQLKMKDEPIAIVLDEYGSISGLITLEDLAEAVVGEIADRRDEKTYYTQASHDVLIASGKLELAQFEEIFEVPLESKANMVTLGGWLIEQIGDIPKPGAKLQSNGFLFHVLASQPNRIRRIYVRRLKDKKSIQKKTRDINE